MSAAVASAHPQRAYVRAPLKVEVTLESEHNFYTGISDNISEGGVFIATYDPPAMGSVVEMTLQLPGVSEPFTVVGVVRWVRDERVACDGCPAGCGVEFVDIPPPVLRLISRFIQQRETILYDV